MTNDEFKKLYKKYMSGECSHEEQRLIESYRDSFDLSDIPWTEEMGNPVIVENALREDMSRRLNTQKVRKFKVIYWASAAAILILLGFVFYLTPSQMPAQSEHATQVNQQIKPGTNKAILTLADNSKIMLDDIKNGTISSQNNVSIIKSTDGEIIYQISNIIYSKKVFNNTITVPRGGQYRLVLADGTKVFLNSASSLTYPVNFDAKERLVKLTGEAYFEVAKNLSAPFKVNVAERQEVEVLGTHFNISAYPDDKNISTTLFEGSVRAKGVNFETLLRPGQMAIHDLKSSTIVIKEADLDEASAWKKGYFKFRKENIQDIMRKVARWYDVDIEYKGAVTNRTFGGTYLRSKTLPGMLELLEYTGSVHFKVIGRRVIVMP